MCSAGTEALSTLSNAALVQRCVLHCDNEPAVEVELVWDLMRFYVWVYGARLGAMMWRISIEDITGARPVGNSGIGQRFQRRDLETRARQRLSRTVE